MVFPNDENESFQSQVAGVGPELTAKTGLKANICLRLPLGCKNVQFNYVKGYHRKALSLNLITVSFHFGFFLTNTIITLTLTGKHLLITVFLSLWLFSYKTQ